MLFMKKLEFSSLIDFFVLISEIMGGGGGTVFYQFFPLSKSQVQAVEISIPRKPKVVSQIR
jgi:hypothetical protein